MLTSDLFELFDPAPKGYRDEKKDYNITQGEIPTFWISNTTHVSTQDRLEYYDVLTKLLFKLKFSYDTGDGTTFKATKQETLL